MNVLTFTGNLGNDCRVANASGTAVCNFSVAMKSGIGTREQTIWVDCALWGKQAEGGLPQYLLKGQQVAVSGELGTREHDGKTYITLRCNTVSLLGSKQEGQQPQPPQQPAPQPRPQPQSFGGDGRGGFATPAGQPVPQAAQPANNFDDFDDGIPF